MGYLIKVEIFILTLNERFIADMYNIAYLGYINSIGIEYITHRKLSSKLSNYNFQT